MLWQMSKETERRTKDVVKNVLSFNLQCLAILKQQYTRYFWFMNQKFHECEKTENFSSGKKSSKGNYNYNQTGENF